MARDEHHLNGGWEQEGDGAQPPDWVFNSAAQTTRIAPFIVFYGHFFETKDTNVNSEQQRPTDDGTPRAALNKTFSFYFWLAARFASPVTIRRPVHVFRWRKKKQKNPRFDGNLSRLVKSYHAFFFLQYVCNDCWNLIMMFRCLRFYYIFFFFLCSCFLNCLLQFWDPEVLQTHHELGPYYKTTKTNKQTGKNPYLLTITW